jgi:O-succinylbenzoate synthase
MGRAARIRVDANAAWSVEEAVTALLALSDFDLEYAEQPCATVEELVEVRRRVEVPIAADESVRKASDPLRVARLGAADVIVVKVAPLGGVAKALRIAEQCGLPVVVSSALDTSVGISAGVALAAALPELPYACGLATTSLMAADVVRPSLDGHGGFLRVGPVTPSAQLLEELRAPADRQRWWRARLERCTGVLGSAT